MKTPVSLLKGMLTTALLIFPFVHGNSVEMIVNTAEEECFYIHCDPAEVTVSELMAHVKSLSSKPAMASYCIEVLEEDAPSILCGWKCKKHGQFLGAPRNYYAPVLPHEESDIHFIITFLANKSLITIASHKGALEEAGDRIDHVHPLKFLATVFTNEERKVGIRNIRAKGWIWGEFVAGIKESLATEANANNLTIDVVNDFACVVGIDPRWIIPSLQARRWEEFIDILIAKIPRKGDHDRYDS